MAILEFTEKILKMQLCGLSLKSKETSFMTTWSLIVFCISSIK